jgi:hypothetical protein
VVNSNLSTFSRLAIIQCTIAKSAAMAVQYVSSEQHVSLVIMVPCMGDSQPPSGNVVAQLPINPTLPHYREMHCFNSFNVGQIYLDHSSIIQTRMDFSCIHSPPAAISGWFGPWRQLHVCLDWLLVYGWRFAWHRSMHC